MPSVCSAVWPSSLTCRSIPLRSSQAWKSASEAFASSTMSGTLRWNADTWSATGLESRKPIAVTASTTHAITVSTASPRGKRARRSSDTNGFSSSAISAATMNSSTIGAGRAEHADDAEDRQRQQHELHPARQQHRRDARGGWRVGIRERRHSTQKYAPRGR